MGLFKQLTVALKKKHQINWHLQNSRDDQRSKRFRLEASTVWNVITKWQLSETVKFKTNHRGQRQLSGAAAHLLRRQAEKKHRMTAKDLQEGLTDTEVAARRSSVLTLINRLVMTWVLTLNVEPWINVNYVLLQPCFQMGWEAADAEMWTHCSTKYQILKGRI